MQYWIFYAAGVGGDGFRNLLEHAENITPVDGIKRWKLWPEHWPHKIKNNKIRFQTIPFGTIPFDTRPLFPFRSPLNDIELNQVELLPGYRNLVETGQNTVIAVHPLYYDFNPSFKYWNFIQRDQHKIILYSTDYIRIYEDFNDKNFDINKSYIDYIKNMNIPNNGFPNIRPHEATLIDIEQVWRDWDYLNNILISIGISLDRKYYEEYLDVSKRRPN